MDRAGSADRAALSWGHGMTETRFEGVCPICETKVTFVAASDWYRDTLAARSSIMALPNKNKPADSV